MGLAALWTAKSHALRRIIKSLKEIQDLEVWRSFLFLGIFLDILFKIFPVIELKLSSAQFVD